MKQRQVSFGDLHPEVRQQILDYFARHHYVVAGKYLRADTANLYFAPLPDDAKEELATWMSGFDVDSILELDYWGLTGLLPTEELEADRSAGEIWACLEAMELGDVDESRRRYSELVAWWEQIRSVERAN